MKHVFKALGAILVLVLAAGVFSACGGLTGLKMENEGIASPETVARNKEPYSATLVPYDSVEQALGCDISSSPYYMSLNGDWDFTCAINPSLLPEGATDAKYTYEVRDFAPVRRSDGDETVWGTIKVPANWEMEGFDAPSYTYNSYPWDSTLTAPNISDSYNPAGIYRRTITVPSDWSGRQVYVTLEGVSSCVYVYVNGALVGYGEDSYTGKTFNLTDAVHFGSENQIAFVVYKYCDASYLEANDSIKFGGIYRDVYLYSAPGVQLRDLTFDMQMSGQDALLNLTVSLAGYGGRPGSDYSVEASVYDQAGNQVLQPTRVGMNASFPDSIATTANAYLCDVGGRLTVPSPKLWSAETPDLYTLVLELKDGDDVVDRVSKRIGLKTVGVQVEDSGKQTFMINDRPVILRGILYNENSPVNGMAMTKDEMIADIKQMKSLNINAVRSPGRPLSEAFIALCDEYGLYVVDDMSLNSNPYSNEEELSIPGDQSVWQTACLDRLLNVVYRDKNSASVIMWNIGNNSGTGANFSVLRTWLTAADTRLIVYDDDTSASDMVVSSDLSLNDFVQLLRDPDNKKAVLVQDTNGALLNNGGNFSAYSEMLNEYSNFQGGFFGYWTDNAIYWPINAAEANELMQTVGYTEDNMSSFRLTYAGGWGDTTSAATTYKALAGIVTADRKIQSDAKELKNALSPIYISAVDAKSGEFRISNRNGFTALSGNYEITWEVTAGAEPVKSGTVSGLDLPAGASKTFSVDYGTLADNVEYYIYFTVKHASKPAWLDGEDLTVFAKQIPLTENKSVPKDGSVRQHDGAALELAVFQAPKIYVSNYSIGDGKIYVTNNSLVNFNDVYTLSWIFYEQHSLWINKRWVVYDEGTLGNFNVPAGSVNREVTLPLKTHGAAQGALYAGYLTLTLKQDVGEVPAGTQFVYALNYSLGGNLYFHNDPARNPQVIYEDENDDEGTLIPAVQDTEPELNEETDIYELPELPVSYDGNSFLQFNSDKLALNINADTGLISSYEVGGKSLLVGGSSAETAGMISNLMRNATGGDLSGAVSASTLSALKNLSQNYAETKILPHGYQITRVSERQYRVTMDYVWVTYPISYYRSFVNDNAYTVVYDIYTDGELQVSVKYAPSVASVTPTGLSSIITLPADFKTMSWYGYGEGETYSDKTADARVGVFRNKPIAEQYSTDFIYSAGNGDKIGLRWISFEREDGSGVVITSDADLFGVNVSKEYPWNTAAYAPSTAVLASRPTVVRVIGQQRGITAGSLYDQEFSIANYIEPGVNYVYSFRIVPVDAGFDADQISKTVLNSGTVLTAQETVSVSGRTFALNNAVASNRYLSASKDAVIISAALGNDDQYWLSESASDVDVADAIRLKSVALGLYLSPTANDDNGITANMVEMTVAPYKGFVWQNWLYDNNSLRSVHYAGKNGKGYALTIASAGGSYTNSARLALLPALGQDDSKWTLIADESDPSRVRVMSLLTGKYLSVVNRMTFTDPLIENYNYRLRNYSPAAKWNDPDGSTVRRYQPYNTGAYPSRVWAGSEYYITQWDLLPADTQLWTFQPAGDGYALVNKSTGKALTIVDGALAEQDLTNAAEQIWTVTDCDGMYALINPATNMALTLRSVNGTQTLTVSEWKGLAIQKWNLTGENDLKINIAAGSDWYK